MSVGQSNSEIDNILNETEVGQVIAKHKNLVIIVTITIIVGVFVYGAFSSWNKSSDDKSYKLASDFQFSFIEVNKQLEKAFVENKKSTLKKSASKNSTELSIGEKNDIFNKSYKNRLLTLYHSLEEKLPTSPVLFYPAIETSDLLVKHSSLVESEKILNSLYAKMKNNNAILIVGLRLASVLEDLKKNDQAITVLMKLASLKIKAFEAKIYLDLARNYQLMGNSVNSTENGKKAKTNYQFVIDNSTDATMLKLARLGLQSLIK